ncbi:MAG: hypothetical protein ACLTT1_01085 [[Clostridium] scindens]
MRHQDSWALLRMILDLDPQYKNPFKRIEVLEQQFTSMSIHEVLLLSGSLSCAIMEKPTLLKSWALLNSRY